MGMIFKDIKKVSLRIGATAEWDDCKVLTPVFEIGAKGVDLQVFRDEFGCIRLVDKPQFAFDVELLKGEYKKGTDINLFVNTRCQNQLFEINTDGTISPKNARHLFWGTKNKYDARLILVKHGDKKTITFNIEAYKPLAPPQNQISMGMPYAQMAHPQPYPGMMPQEQQPEIAPPEYPGIVPQEYPGIAPSQYPGMVPPQYPGMVPPQYPNMTPPMGEYHQQQGVYPQQGHQEEYHQQQGVYPQQGHQIYQGTAPPDNYPHLQQNHTAIPNSQQQAHQEPKPEMIRTELTVDEIKSGVGSDLKRISNVFEDGVNKLGDKVTGFLNKK